VSQTFDNGNVLSVKIHGTPIRALLDTGSHVSLIKSTLANKLKLSVRANKPDEMEVSFAAQGSRLFVDGVVDFTFNISGLVIAHSVYVVSNVSESLILGADFMSENQVIIEYSNKTVSLCADLVRAKLINNTGKQRVARITKSVCIPAHSEQIVSIKCAPRFSNRDILVEAMPCCQFKKFAIARTVCTTDTSGDTVARILNCEPTALVISRGTKIAMVNSIDVAKDCEPFSTQQADTSASRIESTDINISNEQLEELAVDYDFKINPNLEIDQRHQLLRLLYKYRSCFARDLGELRRFEHYELELTVKDSETIQTVTGRCF
jgi:hypothetical protein